MEDLIVSKNYIDRINIDSEAVEAYKEKDSIRLTFMNGILLDDGKMVEDGGDNMFLFIYHFLLDLMKSGLRNTKK